MKTTDQQPWRSWSRRRLWTTRLTALALSCTLSFCALELVCRLIGFSPIPAPEPKDRSRLHSAEFIRTAQEKSWILWPSESGLVETDEHPNGSIRWHRNSSSFREEGETPIEKPEGSYRIIVTGDSHTDGIVHNDESYANVLERMMNRDKSGGRYDVVNAGFGTYSPYQELWAYKKVLHHFEPDYLVVGFYAGNDFWDLNSKDDRVHLKWDGRSFVHAARPQAKTEPDTAFRQFKDFLRERSAAYHALANVKPLRSAFGTLPPPDPNYERKKAAIEACEGGYWQNLGQAHFFRTHPEHWETTVAMMVTVLKQFQRETERTGTGLVIVIIPSLARIQPELDAAAFADAKRALELSQDDLAIEKRVSDSVKQQCETLGIPCIDLASSFREAAASDPRTRLYWEFDHHISVAGHELTAQELHSFFSQRLPDDVSKPDAVSDP